MEAWCKKYPYGRNKKEDKTQMTLAFRPKKSDDAKGANSSSLIAISYNESMCRESLARMIIVDEFHLNLLSMKGLGTIVVCCSLSSLSQLALLLQEIA